MSPTSCQTAPPRARYRSGIIAVTSKDCQTFLRCNSRESRSLATSTIVRAPRIAEVTQRLEEHNHIGLLRRRQTQRLDLRAPGFGVVAHRVGDSFDLAMVAVRWGEQHVPQSRNLERPAVARLAQCASRLPRAGPRRVVVVRPQQVEAALAQVLDAVAASRVRALAQRGESVRVELAIAEVRSGVAAVAAALADEDLEAALRGLRVAPRRHALATRHRVAELVEGSRRAVERLHEGGERLGDVHQHLLVLGRRRRGTEGPAVAAPHLLVVTHQLGDVARARSQLAVVQDGTYALRPQAVRCPAPPEPVPQPDVHERRSVALDLRGCGPARLVVGPVALGHMAGPARELPGRGQALLEEQPLAELDRLTLARDPVAGVGRGGNRPGAVG